MPPGAYEGFLNDVIGAGLIRAEPPDVAMQSLGVVGVELADRVVRVLEQIAARSMSICRHIYYHG